MARDEDPPEAPAPPAPPRDPLPRNVHSRALALGAQHTCLLDSHEVRCWGSGRFGQLGPSYANLEPHYRAFERRAGEPFGSFVQLESGAWHSCALEAGGEVRCWGHGGYGQLGQGDADAREPVVFPVDGVVAMALGHRFTCVLRENGRVWCAGEAGPLRWPEPEPLEGVDALHIRAGRAHLCAVLRTGSVRCFGENLDAQLGDGTRSLGGAGDALALEADGPERGLRLVLGGAESCYLAEGGGACWGRNDSFQLGDGAGDAMTALRSPRAIAPADAMAFGSRYACRLAEGQVACRGLGHRGQIGDGGRRLRRSWTPVRRLRGASQIGAGAAHACAIVGRRVWCWGANRRGQLGDGTQTDRATPVRVAGVRLLELNGPPGIGCES
ncbi:MAG: hypothetical protein AAF938_30270 [Myxococcota bacterium]